MSAPPPDHWGQPLLVWLATSAESDRLTDVLRRTQLDFKNCRHADELCGGIAGVASAAIVSVSLLTPEVMNRLVEAIGRQEPWSDFPLVLIFDMVEETPDAGLRMLDLLEPLGNVTALQQPVSAITLVSAVHAALRSRRRQLQVRDLTRQPSVGVAAPRQGPGRGGEVGAAHPPGPPRRVLVIEDNADGRDSLRRMLQLWGHHADVAGDGRQGVERALADPPEIALIDIGLPGIDGYQVARRLRDELGDVALVAMTGYGQPHDRQRAMEAGFDMYLVKPVLPSVIRELVDNLPCRRAVTAP